MIRRWILGLILALCSASTLSAQELTGLSRLLDVELRTSMSGRMTLSIEMDRAVPYAVDLVSGPDRVRVRFRAASFDAVDVTQLADGKTVTDVVTGASGRTETWLDLILAQPMGVVSAELTGQSGSSRIEIVLAGISAQEFAAYALLEQGGAAPGGAVDLSGPKRNTGDRPWIVALDPGHGGVDPGADGGRKSEADLMLLFAFELRDALRRAGYEVVMTRDADDFVGLEGRLSVARAQQADVFLSLHADAVLEGVAEGVTLYTLSDSASVQADAKLAARHDRHDILGGVDFTGQGDQVAEVLMDLVRRETRPRSDALARAILDGMNSVSARINSKPIRKGDFAVLRAADIPSVLVELGFLSSARDLAQLNDPAGRARLVDGLVAGLDLWVVQDAADAALIRQ